MKPRSPAQPPEALEAGAHPLGPVWQRLRWNLLLCVLVAGFLTLTLDGTFWTNVVFSLCIGLAIQTLVESGRALIARWLQRRGHSHPALRAGWPGWPWMAPWVLFSALAGHQVGMQLGSLLLGAPGAAPAGDNLRTVFIVLSITLVVSVAFTYHFYRQHVLARAQSDAQAAARLASEHELRLLQSQLEPHMLFNTLANLRVLIAHDPPRAQAMLDSIIGYLRATLDASRSSHHPLRAEFDRLRDYLALMAIRMGPRLQVELELPDELRDVPVPVLLLQPLVENSIRHGLEPKVEGGRLQVQAKRDGAQLLLTVRDTGVGLAARAGTAAAERGSGFGTTQVRSRLRALYGEHATLTLEPAADAPGGTLATLRLPWDETAGLGRAG